jgi:hypothetical protein
MADTTELATAPPVAPSFDVPLTPETVSVLVALAGHPVGQPCPHCCHWILASYADARVVDMYPHRVLTTDGRKATEFSVALPYHEWLAYHHHIVTHQGLDRRMQVVVS